jgi:hypothetical protein
VTPTDDGEGHGGEDQLQRRPDAIAQHHFGHGLARAERRAEIARDDVAATYLPKRSSRGSSRPISLRMRSIDGRVDGASDRRRSCSEAKLPGRTENNRKTRAMTASSVGMTCRRGGGREGVTLPTIQIERIKVPPRRLVMTSMLSSRAAGGPPLTHVATWRAGEVVDPDVFSDTGARARSGSACRPCTQG